MKQDFFNYPGAPTLYPLLSEAVTLIDLAISYKFIKNLVTPFEKWPAYKLGIIDKDGNIIKPRRERLKQEEKDAQFAQELFQLRKRKHLHSLEVMGWNQKKGLKVRISLGNLSIQCVAELYRHDGRVFSRDKVAAHIALETRLILKT